MYTDFLLEARFVRGFLLFIDTTKTSKKKKEETQMYVNVEKKQGGILKVLRPKIVGSVDSKLLICSKDGKIPPTLVPDTGELSRKMGSHIRANFVYTMDGSKIRIGNEVYCRE